ncbi:MAG: bacteriohemerythrin [Methyloprofundus sp.]|nr:bacteriohemerythrin [Methyloprofundus sp.]
MTIVQWDDQYSVGFDHIDNDHKKLFSILDSLYRLMADNVQDDEVNCIIQELLDYTIYHFSEEERFMADMQYPDLFQHRRRHKEFIDQIISYQKEAAIEGMAIFVAVKLANIGSHWLKEHILVIDKRYEQFIHTQNNLAAVSS